MGWQWQSAWSQSAAVYAALCLAVEPGLDFSANESEEALAEKCKASVRAKVEHPFLYVKRCFGYAKVRYRGLSKNTQRLALLLGLANLMTAERHLAA